MGVNLQSPGLNPHPRHSFLLRECSMVQVVPVRNIFSTRSITFFLLQNKYKLCQATCIHVLPVKLSCMWLKNQSNKQSTRQESELWHNWHLNIALTRYPLSTQNFLFFQPMLEPCQASLKADQTCCFAWEHKAQLGDIIVNMASRLINFR